MPVYAGLSINQDAYPRGGVCDAVFCGCVKRTMDLLRDTKESFVASVVSQWSGPSLHRRWALVPPVGALPGEKVVEVKSPDPGRRDTLM